MRNVVHLCLAAKNILLRVNETTISLSCDRSSVKKGRSLCFPKIFIKNKETNLVIE